MTKEVAERGTWGSQLDFILTIVGFAVGLGNVWRFPYLCYQNGGGAFLIPYIIMVILVGIPIYVLELSFGQFASLGPVAVWRVSPFFKGIGFAMTIVTTYIVLYYNVIVAWSLHFFFSSFTSELPWTTCDNWWNSDLCVESSVNASMHFNDSKTPAEDYFYNYVLRISGGIEEGGTVVWQLALLLLFVWALVFIVLINGMQSVGKAAYFVSVFPYIILTAMLIQGAMLPGASTGISYYVTPDFSRLADFKVWSDAATQIFFSLGCCMGSLIAMGSFNNFHHKINREAMIIPIINGFTSFYAGFVIFSTLGYMAELKGVDVSHVAVEGPGLVFVVYPEGLSTLPVAPLWSVLFFMMMTTLGLSSQFSLSESICSGIMDEFSDVLRVGRRPLVFRACFCFGGFLISLPMVTEGGFYVFKMMDDFSAGYPLMIIGLLELIAISWVYSFDRFADDIAMMLGSRPSIFWRVVWSYVSPSVIFAAVITKAVDQGPLQFNDELYPQWANSLAWVIVAFPLTVIASFMIKATCNPFGRRAFKQAVSPTKSWGPALPENRFGAYDGRRPTVGEYRPNEDDGAGGRTNPVYYAEDSKEMQI